MVLKLTIDINDVCKVFGHGNTPEQVAQGLRKLADELGRWDYFTEGVMSFGIGVMEVSETKDVVWQSQYIFKNDKTKEVISFLIRDCHLKSESIIDEEAWQRLADRVKDDGITIKNPKDWYLDDVKQWG